MRSVLCAAGRVPSGEMEIEHWTSTIGVLQGLLMLLVTGSRAAAGNSGGV